MGTRLSARCARHSAHVHERASMCRVQLQQEGTEAAVAGPRRNAGRYVHLPLRRLVLHEASTRFRALLWRVPKRTTGRSAVGWAVG